jgi:hypothetical protein
MYFIGNLRIDATGSLSDIADLAGKALGLEFHEDFSGQYEEFPAFVSDVLGMQIAILGIPSEEWQDPDEPMEDYELLVRTDITTPDDKVETDLSIHLCHLLREVGISCALLRSTSIEEE